MPLPAHIGDAASRPLTTAEAEQVAWTLGAPAVDVAFVRASQGLYFARRVHAAISPVLRLLSGIHAREPQCARWIARREVYSTALASATCRGVGSLAARRLRPGLVPRDHAIAFDPALVLIDAGAAPPPHRVRVDLEAAAASIVVARPESADDPDWLSVALALAALVARSGRDPLSGRTDRPIAAVLVGADGALLEWATHTGARNALRHAEVNLVECFLRDTASRLPTGSRLYTTRKPCRMCAGLLWDAAEDPLSLRVLFAEDDTGRYARATVLDAGSAARRRETQSEAAARQPLQWLWKPGGS